MKLYYNPYGCSLAPAIAAAELGIDLTYMFVDILKDPHLLRDGTDYASIAPRNYVPLLELDTGERMGEVAVILQYLADRKPGTIAPAQNTRFLAERTTTTFTSGCSKRSRCTASLSSISTPRS